MKSRLLAILLILFCSAAAVVTAQDNILERYSPLSIPVVINEFTSKVKSDADYVSVTENYLIKTRVTYTGTSRKVSAKKQEFLSRWLKDNQFPPEMLPKEEFQFRVGEDDYWLVMQSIVAPHFVHEIKPGASVDLYMILMGSVREGGNRDYVFLINEFKRPEDKGPSGSRTGTLGSWDTGDVIKGFDRYVPRTLKEIIDAHSSPETLGKSNMLLTGDTFPSRVKVSHTGMSRKTPAEKKRHLQMLIQSFSVSPEVVAQYDTELLFLEGKDEHWLPVQARLIPFFEKELVKGEEITIYAEWVGASKVEGKWVWVFVVNEFQKLRKPTITETLP